MNINRSKDANKSSSKKTTVNLFIDSLVLNELKDDSGSRGLSLNANINRVLMKYISFYRRAEDLQCVFFTGKDFRFVIDNIDESKLLDNFVQNLTDLIPSSLNERGIPTTLENLIKFEYSRMALDAGIVHKFSTFRNERGLFCLMFQHSHGIKWSRILAKGYTQQIDLVLNLRTEYNITPTTVVITFQDRHVISEEEIAAAGKGMF